MVLVSYSGREINAKLVYYGPGLSGKTTNLEYIYGSIPDGQRGKMVSMKTKTERTLFFDFLPVNLGELSGFKTRFLLYTVPGQVYYNATRKLVLKGVDAVVFVADSKRGKMDENVESLENLKENLREHGLTPEQIPFVIQYNKRDLPDVYSVQELEAVLNPNGVPSNEAVATTGQGVVDTFKSVSRLLLRKLAADIGVSVVGPSPSAPAPPMDRIATAGPGKQDPPVSRGNPEAPVSRMVQAELCLPAHQDAPTFGWASSAKLVPPSPPTVPDPEPVPAMEYTPLQPIEPALPSDRAPSVGERLRRWLSRPAEPEFASSTEPETTFEPVAEPTSEPTLEPRWESAAAEPIPIPADEPPSPPNADWADQPVLAAPPAKAPHKTRSAVKAREVIVPLVLEPDDLERGIVLRLAIQAPWLQTDEEDGEDEESAAA
jgi:mutual gliding-motility protein MglA